MRFFSCFIMIIVSVFSCVFLSACNAGNDNVIRIHIRANSNTDCDQNIKLVVRDNVIDFITPIISSCEDSEDVKFVLQNNLAGIESIANDILVDNGFDYLSSVKICNEYFPSRDYDGKIFPADYYDALIIKLGSGKGDNWWCVAYPPLCFVGEDLGTDNVIYRSKIIELINKFFN